MFHAPVVGQIYASPFRVVEGKGSSGAVGGQGKTPSFVEELADEVAEELKADKRYEAAYRRRVTRNKAQYSLDCDDGIEYSACLHEPSPEELVLRAERFFYLWNALNTLPEMRGRRVEACVIDDKSYAEVGRTEGVHSGSVRGSVLRGLESMKEYLKENW